MSAKKEETITGAVVQLEKDEAGIYTAYQVSNDDDSPPADGEDRVKIDWSYGPIRVSGYLNTDSFQFDAVVGISGISLGNVRGDLRNAVEVRVNLFTAKGEVKFYLKNGNEVWIANDIMITFNGHYSGDFKITSF